MKLDINKIKELIKERGWNEVIFARNLNLDYSYVYRVMRGQRGIGVKFISELMKFCEREKLNFKDYIILR
ncbi:hypothetical protein BBF96_10600 [Anoxybacter fermentans]|uniref:HTH cro/C1-type domain-containing protein n=1 Tax=Anoxybacter fermentans TaxID=1323375 RepID=A0A3Q9HT04_9FIRM|nr:hypothetical protein [Anoxybacter fermentans]AZR73794.1 hypothetical protein BBF96_10600 [Anoxybacter fermentans]